MQQLSTATSPVEGNVLNAPAFKPPQTYYQVPEGYQWIVFLMLYTTSVTILHLLMVTFFVNPRVGSLFGALMVGAVGFGLNKLVHHHMTKEALWRRNRQSACTRLLLLCGITGCVLIIGVTLTIA